MTEADGYENGLFDIIDEYFDLEELKDFCFKLNVDYDNLEGGENKKAKHESL